MTQTIYGYAPQHLTALLQVGAALRKGGTLTPDHVRAIAAAHPAVPMRFIVQKAEQVNALPAGERAVGFIRELTGGGDAAIATSVDLIDRFSDAYDRVSYEASTKDFADAINARTEARRSKDDQPARPSDTPRYVKSDTRLALEGAIAAAEPARVINHSRIADRLERAVDVLEKPDGHSLHDSLSAAFDAHTIESAVEQGKLRSADE